MKDQVGKILIIEDSPTQALQLTLFLEQEDYKILTASTGKEGLELLEEAAPDLIILDVVLPDLDGYTVCRRIRHTFRKYIPILMLTAMDKVDDRVDGLEVGADDYMVKPFEQRELAARVKALLRIKRLHDDLNTMLTEERQSARMLRKVALIDHLTGVYNRHYLIEIMENEIKKSKRYDQPLACMIIDVDHFRDFNTQFGHTIGDWVLQQLATLMKECVREADVVARYGGDEFIILQPMTLKEDAVKSAERICDLMNAKRWESPKGELNITISIGVAALPDQNVKTAQDLIDCADKALYQGKDQGRNRVCVHCSDAQ